MDAGWLDAGRVMPVVQVAGGAICGAGFVGAFFGPFKRQAERRVRALDVLLRRAEDELRAKRAESARYAAAIARITTSLASAKPDPSQPFYPHRLAAFREAVAVVLDACKEAV